MKILVAMLAALCAAPAIAQPPPDRILVMPFDNVRRDARLFWIGEGASVLLTDDLNAMGLAAIQRPERQQALERLQVPPVTTLTDATVIRIGQLVGAASIVIGSLQLDEGVLTIHARSIALGTGRVAADIAEHGPLNDLFSIVERVARGLAPASTKTTADVERQHPPIAVFENYIKGVLAETPDTAINYLNAALRLQPGFDRARLALWDVYTDQGEYEDALKAVKPIAASSPLSRRAKYLAGLSQLDLKQYDDAFATFKALADEQATPAIMNNLGVIQLQRSAPQNGQPTYYFTKAADADLDDPDYAFNLGYAYFLDRDTQAAIYWLRETVRRNPTDGDAHFVLGAALAASGTSAVEAARERELARRLSSTYEERLKKAGPGNDIQVPRGLERVKQEIELPHARRIETRLTTNEQRSQQELATFYLNNGRRLFQEESDRQASEELSRALYLSPYLAEAHLLLGHIHLRTGRIHEAIDAFKISLWSAESAEGHAALGEAYRQNKDMAAARVEAERALEIDPQSAEARQLLARLDAR